MAGLTAALLVADLTLPSVVLFASFLPVAFAAFLEVCRRKNWLSNGKLAAYFLVDFIVVVFNMLYLSVYAVATVSVWETLFVGTFLDMILCTVFFIFAAQKPSYAEVKQH